MRPFARLTLALLLALAPACMAVAQPSPKDASWNRLAGRLRSVAETYKKWGITFEVKQNAFTANPDFCPSTFSVSGGMESPDTVKLDIDAELGRKEALAVGISGTYKVDPDGRSVSGKGAMLVKGTGASYKFTYNSTDGYSLEAGLEETFYSVGVKVGGDGTSPLSLGLKLGPATVNIDPIKWINRCRTVGPALGHAAAHKVGGVLIRTDLEFMAAALSNAPPPSTLRLRDVTLVSLKRLLRASRSGSAPTLGPLTSVIGFAVDAEQSDVILVGRVERGMPRIPVTVLSALLRSVWRDGLAPFVSLDPSSGAGELRLKPRIGGLSAGLNKSALVSLMLAADYRMKSALYGDVKAGGVTPITTALARAPDISGTGTARFWFTPRPLEYGDVGIVRASNGSLTTFDVQPMVLTEKMTRGFGEDQGAGASDDPMERVLKQAATELTRAYPALEQAQPEMRLKELRQIFELSTAAAILRRQRPPAACARLLDRVAALEVPSMTVPDVYIPLRKSFQSAATGGTIEIWGGVTSDAGAATARVRVEKSLATVLAAIQNARWSGASAAVPGVFDPVIADAEALDRTEAAHSHLAVGEQYLKQRSFSQALGELNLAIELDAANVRAYYLRSVADYMTGDLRAGIADAASAVRLAPNEAMGYFLRAYSEMDSGHVPSALQDLTEAIRLSPNWSEPYVVRGLIRTDFDPPAALRDFDMALKSAKYTSSVLTLRGLAHLRLGDKDAALADFTAAIRADPRNGGPYGHRADLLAERKEYKDALEDRRRVAELRPSAEHCADLALAELRVEDFAAALGESSRAIEMDPQLVRGYQLRGRAEQELGRIADALADFEAALAHNSDSFLQTLIQHEIDACRKLLADKP
jgi:tetratricopeptide (TPR) repeat protein